MRKYYNARECDLGIPKGAVSINLCTVTHMAGTHMSLVAQCQNYRGAERGMN